MSARLKHGAAGQDRSIKSDDIVALAHDHAPPVLFEIILQLDPEWSVIPNPIQSAVNLARLENESAPFAQADDLFHALWIGLAAHNENENRGLRRKRA